MSDHNDQNDLAHWHLDRRVPIALILTILIQSGSALWWAAGVSAKVDTLERQAATNSNQAERIVRLETKMDAIFGSLSDIKAILQGKPH